MIDTKYNIINLIPASQCFFKHRCTTQGLEGKYPVGSPDQYDSETIVIKKPLVGWAIAETKDPKFTNATMRQIVGIYIDTNGELAVCEERDDFAGYLHQPLYQLAINN